MKIRNSMQLGSGTFLHNRYYIVDVLGSGGFGITYRAIDEKLQINVAIKEFFPNNLITRNSKGSQAVMLLSETYRLQYERLKKSFLDEARTLARIDDLAYAIMQPLELLVALKQGSYQY